MSIEISFEQKKEPLEFDSASDFQLAKKLIGYVEVNDEKKRLRIFLEGREKGLKVKSPASMSELSNTNFDVPNTEKERQEFPLAEKAREIASEGKYMEAVEIVANLETKLLRAHTFGFFTEILDRDSIDATPVFILAMDSVRDFLNDDIDSLDAVSGVEMAEEVLNKACELGYFNVVRMSAERMMDLAANHKELHRDLLISVVSILINSAGLQKEDGLSDQEI